MGLKPDRYLTPLIRWVHLTVKDLSLGVLVNKSQQTKLGKITVLEKAGLAKDLDMKQTFI